MRASKFTEGRKRGEMWGEFTSGVFRVSLLFGRKKAQHEPLHYLFMFLAMPLLSQFKYRPASNKNKKNHAHINIQYMLTYTRGI